MLHCAQKRENQVEHASSAKKLKIASKRTQSKNAKIHLLGKPRA